MATRTIFTVSQDDNGMIYVYDRQGDLVISHPRAASSNLDDAKLAEDMVTDISMVSRAAIVMMTRRDKTLARLNRVAEATERVSKATAGLNERLADQ